MIEPELIRKDPWLKPFEPIIVARHQKYLRKLRELVPLGKNLSDYPNGHFYYGLHHGQNEWVFREWAPNATSVFLIGDFSKWKPLEKYKLAALENGNWEITLPEETLKHGDLYKLHITWEDGEGHRIPSYANRVIQDPHTLIFSAQVWNPPAIYQWHDKGFKPHTEAPCIYEAHIGMSSTEEKIAGYTDFKETILPRIHQLGYNTIQLMAIQEHPYYGSFGYHVSNFFAPSSRFGTPEELKALIDEAHKLGINVIMDIVHSHAVKNELEGLSRFDGSPYQYFHDGPRGNHPAWDSRCFNYGKNEVIHFLLSNCKYWLEEFHFDGYRFDGVTSMLYLNHGLGIDFTSYSDYFKGNEDDEAIVYLCLANQLIHEVKPHTVNVAEEMSGYPGLSGEIRDGGIGFDYRLSMGVPDYWIKLIKEIPDDKWSMGAIYHELTQHRIEEKTINYAESHDQALVGDKTIIFRLMDKDMYFHMGKDHQNLIVDRGIALHKLIRFATLTTNHGGYLNFMGNEFGHPEWIDFPREGNNWSYKYARRQWHLADDKNLKYHYLNDFDRDMIHFMVNEQANGLPGCFLISANDNDKILAFSRGDLVFVFNFHPTNSYTDYGVGVSSGKYKVMLNSDKSSYGGFNRIDDTLLYYSQPTSPVNPNHQLLLYIPSRVAMVLKRIPIPKVY